MTLKTKPADGARRLAVMAAARAALCALWLCAPALPVPAQAPPTPHPRDPDLPRAAQALAGLRSLGDAADAADAAAFRRLARQLYPALPAAVAALPPGDLKTDLDTAAALYAEAARTWEAAARAPARCDGERPDTYLPLCRRLHGPTALGLLLAKARLHASWAEATARAGAGAADAETARALAEIKAARAGDLLIAARAVAELKPLAAAATRDDDEEGRAASGVSPERLDAESAGALARAAALLRWLPRGPSFYALRGAWRSYADGLFWLREAGRAREMVVSAAEGFAPDPPGGRGAGRAGSAASANWRAGAKYMRRAEQSLSR